MNSQERYCLGRQVAWVGALVNLGLAFFKLCVGYFGKSQALMADGVHSFSDLICSFLVLIAAKYGNADADEDHPYGHYRIETLMTLALGMVLILVGIGIAINAAFDIAHGEFFKPSVWTVLVAMVSILANEGLFFYTRNIANQLDSNALRANASHARSDSLASLIVLIGLIGSLCGWLFLDAIAAIVVSLIIIKMGSGWAWVAVSELVDKGLDEQDLSKIREVILKTEGVLAMHQLRTRKMASRTYLDVHILINPYSSASEGHQIAERVHVRLSQAFPNIFDTTIHIDVENHPEVLPKDLLITRSELIQKLIFSFKNLISPEEIKNLDMYYLNNKIEANLCLDLKILERMNLEDLDQLSQKSLREIEHLRKLKISFQ